MPNEDKQSYTQVDWILTEKALVQMRVTSGDIVITSYPRQLVSKVERHFGVVRGWGGDWKPVLTGVSVVLKGGETCRLLPPQDADHEMSVAEYEKMVGLL